MAKLPSMINVSKITRSLQTEFGSYNHTDSACNGDIYDMENLCSDKFPLLTPRKPRKILSEDGNIAGILNLSKKFVLKNNGDFFYGDDSASKGTVEITDGEKKLYSLGNYVVIMPDKIYIDLASEDFENGTIEVSETYKAKCPQNIVTCTNAEFDTFFKKGDAVTLSVYKENEESTEEILAENAIIRDISEDKLTFDENLTLGKITETTIVISRKMPDMDFMCENENRLWGCKGSTVYACKPGDIFNWNVFDGISTDSFSVSVGSPGDFTGCISYKGYPCFFKEDYIYKVYGDKPSNFQLLCSASSGVAKNCEKSLAVAGETLFYMSRTGICAYAGGIPSNISECFGDTRYTDAVAGSDGNKYYVSMKEAATCKYVLFVYDTRFGTWHKEDSPGISSFARCDGVLHLITDNGVYCIDDGSKYTSGLSDDGDIDWFCEFADIYEYSTYNKRSSPLASKKGTVRFYIRAELEKDASMKVEIKFDSEDSWQQVASELGSTRKRTCVFPIIPRRADHFRLKLSGTGECTIHSITREYYPGSFM